MDALKEAVKELDNDILDFIHRGVEPHDPETFNRLALRIFELQFANIPLYQRFCLKREISPQTISSWKEIPALATDVFKTADFSLLPDRISRTFTTSGSGSAKRKGRVSYDDGALRLMDATIRAAASALLFPDGVKPILLILAPQPRMAPHMVMVYGMERLIEYFGRPESRFLVDEKGFNARTLVEELLLAQEKEIPVAVCGGSFGFVNFFDFCIQNDISFRLPAGSRILDAGGFKGRSREVGKDEFLDYCEKILGIQRDHCVNLLGMTEISSQYYDNVFRNHCRGISAERAKVIPPWTRVQAVDPDSLEPLPDGEIGLLKHVDLANRGHVSAIQTDDLGRIVPGGFEVFGRAWDDQSRGCSLSIEEMTRILEA